jgi:hypothetical protein
LVKPSQGVLLIADITGYTMYLQGSELEHAHGVLSDLLAVLVEGTRPPLAVSNLQGDAVFSYGIDSGQVSGQTFVEMVEAIYVAFRRAIEEMVMNASCGCNACANLGTLDLKFIIHHGEFLIQTIGISQELVGSDVIVAHRLAKNTVTATTGVRAYAVYTSAAVEALEIAHLAEEWIPHREVYDAGEVECWITDMTPVWEEAKNRSVAVIEESDYRGKASVDIAAPVEQVWDRLADPDLRRVLVGSDRQVRETSVRPRLGAGDVYQCYHGAVRLPSTIIEWLPFSRMLTKDENIQLPGGATVDILVDYQLEPTEVGTRLTMAGAHPEGTGSAREVFYSMDEPLKERLDGALAEFKHQVEAMLETSSAV